MIWEGLKWLGSVIAPCLGKRPATGLGRLVFWTLHFLFITLVVLFLWFINYYFDLERALRSPWPALHKFWLPLLFLLFYVLCWLGYGLWQLLGPERTAGDFPDIDSAWAQASRALAQASISLDDAPLFLVLGRPAAGEENLFNAADLQLAVQQTPRAADAPLHVYANRDGIFVTCAESSLLGHQARLFAEQSGKARPKPAASANTVEKMQAILELAKAQGRGPDQLTLDEKQEISQLVVQEKSAAVPESSSRPLLKNKADTEMLTARLQYLCRLIAQDRRPYCPINGIILLLPLASVAGDVEASQIASLAHQDLHAARRILQVDCPVFAVVCDLEQAPGFREFLDAVPEGQKHRPLGQRFPLVPDIDPPELPMVFEGGVDWLCRRVVADNIYRLFRIDTASALRINARLYQFLAHIRAGRKRLGRILHRGTQTEMDAPPMVAGCFLAATGIDSHREQAFVAGIFQDLLQNQNYVAWTPQALNEDAGYRRWTRLGYFALLLLLAGLGAAAYFLWFVKRNS